MDTAIVAGSISDVVQTERKSLALAFMNVETVVIVDTSGSMGACDSRGGKSRYNVAVEELSMLQGSNPGKILVISFSDEVKVCLNGVPYNFMGGTIVGRALQYAKQYDLEGMNIILIRTVSRWTNTKRWQLPERTRTPSTLSTLDRLTSCEVGNF